MVSELVLANEREKERESERGREGKREMVNYPSCGLSMNEAVNLKYNNRGGINHNVFNLPSSQAS